MAEEIKVGQYILVRRIGEGGMAEVWEARHLHLGHRVAVKFLLPEYARNAELQERFLNEGKRQAQLQHPNIVPAIDFFQIEGRSYLVMQFVDGRDLESRLEQGPLSLDEFHSISWDVLSALDHAHTLDVVHRDVKPANVLLDRSGRALLMDFGIAKALREQRSVTLTSTSMGTPDYMSPEQIVSTKGVDARSDIYSFGCVLYAMLTGGPPFSSENATVFHVQQSHVSTPPPPPVFLNPAMPAPIGDVVLRCLEKSPANRYQTCRAVMAALDQAIANEPVAAAPPPVVEAPAASGTGRGATKVDSPPSVESGPQRKETKAAVPPVVPVAPVVAVAPVAPAPQIPQAKGGLGKWIAIGIAMIAVAAAALYFLNRPHPGDGRRAQLIARDWSKARYDDHDFSDCMDISSCTERKDQAAKLAALSPADWKQVHYDSPVLKDCMGYQPCLDRRSQSDKLQATTDWPHAGISLLGDCMGYAPCLQGPMNPVTPKTQSAHVPRATGDETELPDCCNNASNPAQCRKSKKAQGLQDDCIPLMGNN